MKKIVSALVLLFFLLSFAPTIAFAQNFDESEYESYLSKFDLSSFDEYLDNDTKRALDDLGISSFDYGSLTSLSAEKILNVIFAALQGKFETPLRVCGIVLVFVVISSFFQSLRFFENDGLAQLYSTVSSLVISAFVITKMGSTVALCVTSVSVSANFIYAFIPTFSLIIMTSGSVTEMLSTNSMLLILSQGLSFICSNVFTPVVNCFLAIGICSSLRYEFHLEKLLSTIKKIITTSITALSATFVSVLSLKTAVASKADALGLRSVRFAINSVVPVIGSAISEGLLSIQSYSSLIGSSVGVVGIVAVSLVFLPAIAEVLIWRLLFSICIICADVFGDNSVSSLIKAFADTMLLMNVILILSMVTTIISIGILIAACGG